MDPEGGTAYDQPLDPESMGGGAWGWASEAEEIPTDYGMAPAEAAAATAGGGESWAAEQGVAQGQEEGAGEQAYAATTGRAYSPAEYLYYLEGEIQRLASLKADLEQQMASAATAAYQQVSSKLGEAGTGVPVPANVPALIEELAVLHTVRQYLQYLQELEALTRHMEKAVAALQQQDKDGVAFLQAASGAAEAFSHAMSYVVVVRQLTEGNKVPSAKLKAHARRLMARVDQAQATLHTLISQSIQGHLAACSWPPALAATAGSSGTVAPAAATAAVAAASKGFEAPGAAASVDALQRLLLVLLTLQRAVQHEEFEALPGSSGEPPLLWAAEELAQGVAGRLRHHFAEGLPTDRADKPEWLFAAATKAVQAAAPAVAIFQPCIDAHGLEAWYNLQLEFARAVQSAGVNGVLREHLLPTLAAVSAAEDADASAIAPLWLHLADEAMLFEKRFAPLRGRFVSVADDEDLVTVAHPGSTIELLFEEEAWRDSWLGAEEWDAQRQLEAACDAFSAWQPAQLVLGLPQDSDFLGLETPRAKDTVASRQEFWPPACAEQVMALVVGLVRRCGWVAGADNRRSFMQAVPLAVLRAFRERLGRQLSVAEGYREMLGETWLPSVGAAICAAHYVEHQLREPQGVLLLIEVQDSHATSAAPSSSQAESGEPTPGQDQQQQQQQAGREPKGGGVAPLVDREASAFGALRRQWAYKLAKQAVDRFHELFAPYKSDLSVFTEGYDDGGSGPPAAAAAGHVTEEEAAVSVSPLMLIAADKLLHMLNALSQHLDSVVFRDVWKAVALAVNFALFNEVATEALFSAQGTRQLDADVSALAAVFGQYTSRPGAHFKETKEACKLLLLPSGQAAAVLGALQRQPGAAKEVLRPMGVKLLNADQAATVLMQRLDLLTGMQ